MGRRFGFSRCRRARGMTRGQHGAGEQLDPVKQHQWRDDQADGLAGNKSNAGRLQKAGK
ncbi:hypothetical protein [Phreatobacter stygius]|uniref:hypothetical protein n=1 Tax=Phreatobacter stygius TaxID=1940610 RepID=UPI001B8D7B13|nr:hypothetical protein [Phreatobacter stygius]